MGRFYEEVMGVYFDDLDPFHILHNARYVLLFERTLGAFWNHIGMGGFQDSEHADRFHFVRANHVDYLHPVRGVTRVRVRVWVEKLGRSSLTFGFRMMPLDQDLDHAHGSRTIVRVDPTTWRPVAWTDEFRAQIAPWVGDAPLIAICLAAALAFAQEVPADPQVPADPVAVPEDTAAPGDPDDTAEPDDGVDATIEDGVLTVTVLGTEAIKAARKKVVQDMARLGWRAYSGRNGGVVFKGPSSWMGRAFLDDEGNMSFNTPLADFAGVALDDGTVGNNGPGDDPFAQDSPGGSYQATSRDPGTEIVPQVGFAISPKKKAGIVHDRVLAEVGPELATLRDAIQGTKMQAKLDDLSRHLDALWELGVPLEAGQDEIPTIEGRRRAALTYWATRADNPDGDAFCAAVEEWLQQVVQTSSDPVTQAEQDAANAIAPPPRRLALVP